MKGMIIMSLLELEQINLELDELKENIIELGDSLDLPGMKNELEELEQRAAEPGFWNDTENSQRVLQRTKSLQNKIDFYNKLIEDCEDVVVLTELGLEEKDESVLEEVGPGLEDVKSRYEKLRIETLMKGEYDINDAIITLHAGAGGTEAMDWVQMLFRMYTRWAERNGFSARVLDMLEGDEAGIKSVTVEITGEYAYGYLRPEKGVHRLVRISPFDSSGRRHTSFASMEVMPVLDDSVKVDINPDDIKMDVYRASGAGGQHVNKTSSAVRLTHIPTGIVVACQNERSQVQNRETAMKMLRAKLLELKEKEQAEKLSQIQGEQLDIAWGSQIRSYVFCPYTMVKDHRTNYEEGNIQKVMDGGLDEFIQAYLVNQKQ
ncbi:MAG: peptide chain release factor 2 [Clostridiaceae bacterium]|nr:peptide chain release factor 2 [Clostridiaceae bacterium]